MSGVIKTLLLLPHLKIHNANALSSPFTIGFPAMSAWLGATHALQRQLNHKGLAVSFDATGVVSHHIDLQTYRGANDFVASIVSTGNPLDKTGTRPAFIEEARCHLDVTLLIEMSGFDMEIQGEVLKQTAHLLQSRMKIAGGDIETFQPPRVLRIEENNEKDIARLTRQLMPGYVLIERRELMIEAMEKGQDAIDALLDYLAVHHIAEKNDQDHVSWRSYRKTFQDKPSGWVVPIATGFHGISDLGEAKNQRDPDTPHRFAESLVTLGEFKMAYHFKNAEAMLWRYHYDEPDQLYLCHQSSEIAAEEYDEFAGL